MFPQLPEEIERMIWLSYYQRYVLDDVRKKDTVWSVPSYMLFANSSDPGALQRGYTDLERRYPDFQPHCELTRWLLYYPLDEDSRCSLCYGMVDCEIELDDIQFQRKALNFWDFTFYEENYHRPIFN